MLPDTSNQSSPDASAVRISVIVNNYNYGHFLENCLASVEAQTRAPDQIIVVDDGSTDQSLRRLEGRPDLTVITQANAGQAAAFNAGFAAATGDAVLFLDADDMLRPEAVEVIARLWTSDIAFLSCRLDKIDASGRAIGHYEMDMPDADLLPRMLKDLTIPFMPTSANVFAREKIAWVFPLPVENWKISADALLVRAAVLSGPGRHIRQTLADYRVHGANNYHRDDVSDTAKNQRGILHIAQAGLDLVARADARAPGLSRGHRARLLAAALRHRLRAEDQSPDPEGFKGFLSQLVACCPAARDPRLALGLRMLAPGLALSHTWRRWITEPRSRTPWIDRLIRAGLGRALVTERYSVVDPRPPYDGPPAAGSGRRTNPTLDGLLTAPEWLRDYAKGGYDLCAEWGRFTLHVPVGQPSRVALTVAPLGSSGRRVLVKANGALILSTWIHGEERLEITLPDPKPGAWGPMRVEVQVPQLRKTGRRFPGLVPGLGRLKLSKLELLPLPKPGQDAVLPVQSECAFEDLAGALRDANGRPVQDAETVGPGEWISLAPPALSAPFCLSLRFGPDQPAGDLVIFADGAPIFSGTVGPSGHVTAEMPLASETAFRATALAFSFQPSAFLDGSELWLHTLGWVPGPSGGRYGAPVLHPGAGAVSGIAPGLSPYLGDGWQEVSGQGALMSGPSAELEVSPAMAGQGRSLRLDLEPLNPFAPETPPVVLITRDGVEAARVQLGGRADVDIPLEPDMDPTDALTEIAIHAAGPGEDGVPDADHGGIMLRGLKLLESAEPPALPCLAACSDAKPPLVAALAMLEDALETGASSEVLDGLRDVLTRELHGTAPQAIWHLVTGEDLERLAELGDRLGPSDAPAAEWDGSGTTWLAAAASGLVDGHPNAALTQPLGALPALPSGFQHSVAACLMREPPEGMDRAGLEAHQSQLVARLTEARSALASAPLDSALWSLASSVVDRYGSRALLFSDLDLKPHVSAFGAALEARLLRQGHTLNYASGTPRDPGAKTRVGILLHSTEPMPETYIARALVSALSQKPAEVTLFLTDASGTPEDRLGADTVVGLNGIALAQAVARVRAEDLDVMILGRFVSGAGFVSQLAAHRLAPWQIALTAVTPSTTGFSSVDTVILGDTVTPQIARTDYTEAPAIAPGTGQSFDFGPVDAVPEGVREKIRRDLGAKPDTVVMASSAMEDKISAECLASWLDVLANEAQSMLVLYPFPANWMRIYDETRFEAKLAAACASKSVDRGRVKVLPAIPGEVDHVLAAADLYLDSFPYSGATTVIEALTAGLPVVALAGRTQRGSQAAGWLREHGLADLVAETRTDFVRIASDLASAKNKRDAAAVRVRAVEAPGRNPQFAEWVAAFICPQKSEVSDKTRYLFHHVVKTGGTSLKSILGDWFDIVDDYHEPWNDTNIQPPLDLTRIQADQIISGHYDYNGIHLQARYPDVFKDVNWRPFVFLRDPLQWALSDYHYSKHVRPEFDASFEPMSLGAYLKSRPISVRDSLDLTEDTWRARLDQYWFIGTVERFDDCVAYLAREMGKPLPDVIPYENATPRSEEPDPDDVALFRKNNALEYEIYDAVNARLDRVLGPRKPD